MGKVQALDSEDIQTCGLYDVDGLGWKGKRHCGGIATRRGNEEEAIMLYIQMAQEEKEGCEERSVRSYNNIGVTSCTHSNTAP